MNFIKLSEEHERSYKQVYLISASEIKGKSTKVRTVCGAIAEVYLDSDMFYYFHYFLNWDKIVKISTHTVRQMLLNKAGLNHVRGKQWRFKR